MTRFKLTDYKIDFSILIPATNKTHMHIMHPDELIISYGQYNREKKRCARMKVRIGNDIMRHLKWSHKDKLQMFNFPEDIRKVVIVKRGHGCTAIVKNTKYPYWNFSLIKEIRFQVSTNFAVDYEIHEMGYLIFNLEDPVVA